MTCDFCSGRTEKRRIKLRHWYQGRLFIVSSVDAEVCRECGEEYLHATTLDAIDRLLDAEGTKIAVAKRVAKPKRGVQAVAIDLGQYQDLWEDLQDIVVSELRRKEVREPWVKLEARLRKVVEKK